ncbi:TRL-like family protein [bacterium]|nr:TRL-like family protein [bacterium]
MLCGCAATITPAVGGLWTDVKGPFAVTGETGYSKVGMSTCNSILGWVAMGDASIKAAMENGGITKIHHVDYHATNMLGVYATLTVIVYGE